MGAENSKTKLSEEIRLQRALDRQRRLYEERYSELIENQIQATEILIQQNQNRLNGNNVSGGERTASSPLYPDLQNINNNLQTSNYTSTSNSNLNSRPRAFENSASPSTKVDNENSYRGARPKTREFANTASPSAPAFNNVDNENSYKGARPKPRKPNNVPKVGVTCVTCKNDFGLQIFQCQNGHSSCDKCRFCSKPCGICSKLITDIRNITLEGALADMNIQHTSREVIKCYNSIDGCCLSFTKDEMDTHLAECPFRDMECPLTSIFQNCSWHGKINQIVNHFKDVHPQHCTADIDKEMSLNINENQRVVYLVNIGTFNFIINIKVKLSDGMIYMTSQLLGTKVSASKWMYELHVYNKREPRRKFQYNDVCHSSSASVLKIFDDFNCATLNIDYAKTFANNCTLTYKFFLKKYKK